ncbi:phage baseplate assembly protein V [Paenibacillus sp. 2TAB19]|uniref:phage baseplate assembly protein V n=1 Tax=Paenibacillus sp. 2TAB19 TaxID=3233003 RepID=UPI003F9B02F7
MYGQIKVGKVSTVNAALAAVRVTFPDSDDLVSPELPLLVTPGVYALPEVGASALCLLFGGGAGICLGSYYNDHDPPMNVIPSRYGTWFADGSHVYYDKAAGELKIKAASKVHIEGDLVVSGTINHGGLIP